MTVYEPVLALADLPLEIPTRVEVDGEPVCLVRRPEGIYAINDICTHAEVSLSEGDLEGCSIECWLHGSRFDLATGEPSGPPANVPVATYAVRIDGVGDGAKISVALTSPAEAGVPVPAPITEES